MKTSTEIIAEFIFPRGDTRKYEQLVSRNSADLDQIPFSGLSSPDGAIGYRLRLDYISPEGEREQGAHRSKGAVYFLKPEYTILSRREIQQKHRQKLQHDSIAYLMMNSRGLEYAIDTGQATPVYIPLEKHDQIIDSRGELVEFQQKSFRGR